MKYNELIHFEPIHEVVKIGRLVGDTAYREALVRNFVFSKAYREVIIREACKWLDPAAVYETFGLQVVGDYGTGKSHLMSLLSLIAEDADLLPLVADEDMRTVLRCIAGRYKVVRFELGTTEPLWEVLCHQIDRSLALWGMDYSIANDSEKDMYGDKLRRLMAQFEQEFPDRGLLIIIDEMLAYLRARSTNNKVYEDLLVLQALGQSADHSRFRIIFGVQEQLFADQYLQMASDVLSKTADRYKNLQITSEDVQFIAQMRVLCKTDAQKGPIRARLEQFTRFFPDMQARMDLYVDLFPIHPDFFSNFRNVRLCDNQNIKKGGSQREVLKTITAKFEQIADQEWPHDMPGLICYDSYWEDLNTGDTLLYPDVRRVSEIMKIIHQKITDNFGKPADKPDIPWARRIANACAVKILQEELNQANGATDEQLVRELCPLEPGMLDQTHFDHEYILGLVRMIAKKIVRATVGQYFVLDAESQQFRIRTEGGVNFQEEVDRFASTLSDDQLDEHFYGFLTEYLPIETASYMHGVRLYQHQLTWQSHRAKLPGYIFMGIPADGPTANPRRLFYIYFLPCFNKKAARALHPDGDENFYVLTGNFSKKFRDSFRLYAAALSKAKAADSTLRHGYIVFRDKYLEEVKNVFNNEFTLNLRFVYRGQTQPVRLDPNATGRKIDQINEVAENILEGYFYSALPWYPSFNHLTGVFADENRQQLCLSAIRQIAQPQIADRDGMAVLAALELTKDCLPSTQLDADQCRCAQTIKQLLAEKGEGMVLNSSEVIYKYHDGEWRMRDTELPADLTFVVLCAMVKLGMIELLMPANLAPKSTAKAKTGLYVLNSVNIKEAAQLPAGVGAGEWHLRQPKGLNAEAVIMLFKTLIGVDVSDQLLGINPEHFAALNKEATEKAQEAAECARRMDEAKTMVLGSVWLLDAAVCAVRAKKLKDLRELLDEICRYTTQATMAHLPYSAAQLKERLLNLQTLRETRKLIDTADAIINKAGYLSQAKQYLPLPGGDAPADARTDSEADAIEGAKPDQKFGGEAEEIAAAIDKAVGQAPDIINKRNDETALRQYTSLLDALSARYADWYVAQYKRWYLNETDIQRRDEIEQSPEKRICDEVCPVLRSEGYTNNYARWLQDFGSLQPQNDIVNREAVLRVPCLAGFNPSKFAGKREPDIDKVLQSLNDIYERVCNQIAETFRDPAIVAKLQTPGETTLDNDEQTLAGRMAEGLEQLTTTNARRVAAIVAKLRRGIVKKVISTGELQHKVFARPMTQQEAVKAFSAYLADIMGRSPEDNVRIVLKTE